MIARSLITGVVMLGVAMSSAGQASKPTSRPAAKPAGRGESLARFVPADVVFFYERAGMDAIQEAFDGSNVGAMFRDPVMARFIKFARTDLLATVVDELGPHDLRAADARTRTQRQTRLLKLLTPVWNNPGAFFLLPPPLKGPDGAIVVIPPDQRKDPQAALNAMMEEYVQDTAKRRAFTWTTGKLTWRGVAGSYREFELPADADKLAEALADKDVFMFCWTDEHLLMAASTTVAEAMNKCLSGDGGGGLASRAAYKTVMETSDAPEAELAFRWFVDLARYTDGLFKDAESDEHGRYVLRMMKALEMGNERAVGGMGGYEKKTLVQRTFTLGPNGDETSRLFVPGGSYKAALAMIPRNSAFALAGQVDPKATAAMVRRVALAKRSRDSGDAQPDAKLDDVLWTCLDDLAAGSDGNVGVFLGQINLAALMRNSLPGDMLLPVPVALTNASPTDSSPPLGMVLGMKDAKSAAAALASLRKCFDDESPADRSGDGDGQAASKPAVKAYREVEIHPLGPVRELTVPFPLDRVEFRVHVAATDDRLILGISPQAVRMAIDAAKAPATRGGFAANSKGAKYADLAGDGPGVFFVDHASLVQTFWPLVDAVKVAQFAEGLSRGGAKREESFEERLLRALPDSLTLMRHLGPEVAVFDYAPDGLLHRTAGLLPFGAHTGLSVAAFVTIALFE